MRTWTVVSLLTVAVSALPAASFADVAEDYALLKERAIASGKVEPALRGPSSSAALHADAARVAGGPVQVYVHVRGALAPVLEALAGVGADVQVVNDELGMIQASLLAEALDSIAALDGVTRISEPSRPTPRAGSVVTEGDTIHRADELRDLSDGTGVRVGVISDGVDNAAASRATGDLPPQLSTVAFPGQGDEGTAMLEIIHDIAPGATLGFCGPGTSLEMIVCLTELADTFQAQVVVDDLGFFLEPYFQDGPVARAVRRLVDRDIVYASSAGNTARSHHAAEFLETRIPAVPRPVHNFGGAAGGATDGTLDLRLPPGETINVVLQWNDPFGASANDYDLVLLDETGTEIIASSLGEQDGDDDPIERLVIAALGEEVERAQLVVTRFSGEDRRVKVFVFGPGGNIVQEHRILAGTIFGHPAVPGVLATAAINASDPGNDQVEPFSSRGPVRIFFPEAEVREKPDLAAVDGVSVTGAGGFPTPFFGTSAAAPHVAGVAAQLKAFFTRASGRDVADALRASAVPLDGPGEEPPPEGRVDPASGAGRMDAVAAAFALNRPPDGDIVSPDGDLTVRPGASVPFVGRAVDPEGLPVSVLWQFGGAAPESDLVEPGEIVFTEPGEYVVRFLVVDAFEVPDPNPPVRIIRVRGGGGGGGSCAVAEASSPFATAAPLGIALAALVRSRSRRRARCRT